MGDPGGPLGPRPLDHLLRPRQAREEGDLQDRQETDKLLCEVKVAENLQKNQLEKLEAAKAAILVCLSLLGLT